MGSARKGAGRPGLGGVRAEDNPFSPCSSGYSMRTAPLPILPAGAMCGSRLLPVLAPRCLFRFTMHACVLARDGWCPAGWCADSVTVSSIRCGTGMPVGSATLLPIMLSGCGAWTHSIAACLEPECAMSTGTNHREHPRNVQQAFPQGLR